MAFIQADIKKTNHKIGIVSSRFNRPVTEKLEQGALNKLLELGYDQDNIKCLSVPGAVEIPLAVKWLYEQGYDAVVTVGAVIRGETAHFDYVCNSVERGCSELCLEYSRPLGFGVITTENAEQAFDRCGGKKGNKGAEAAEVVVELLNLKTMIS